MNGPTGPTPGAVSAINPGERNQALAEARRNATQSALQNAEAAEARRADNREQARAILERAVGANTRVSISRPDQTESFVYQAIDVNTGEVVREWPPADFARFLEQNAPELLEQPNAGVVIDEQA
ncbi:MAG: flagellar protein FlaG [Pseudomonadota bacterium]